MRIPFAILFAAIATMIASAATPPETQRNFVACPIVRDTQTVPCWLAEYNGELYFLGIQADISADWYPPYLGHRVLVEGVVANQSRICGGIVLKPNTISVLPDLDPTCNTQLPAEDRYTVPFAPRGPGPSRGSVTAVARAQSPPILPPYRAREFSVPYEFNAPSVTGRTARVLQQAVSYANAIHAARIEVMGYRGAVLLSSGELLTEQDGIAEQRASQVRDLLIAVGVAPEIIFSSAKHEATAADGVRDFEQRRVTIAVRP